MRGIARQKLGYFPLSQKEAERIRRFLSFREDCGTTSVLDPCAGGGAAMATITSGAKTLTYGIELDSFRAEEARLVLGHVLQGNCFDVQSAVESFSLLFENPPYDFEVGENRNGRMEFLFLEHTYRWLKPGGVLALVVPGDRLSTCAEILAVHFRDKAIYRLREPESIRYKQIVVFGVRQTRRERDQLKDGDVQRAKTRLLGLARSYDECQRCPTKLIRSSWCRRAGLLNWCIAAFRWTRWRICCRHPQRIDRPAEFCLHRKSAQPAGRSLRSMAATLAR